jgi:hypothetical protein
MAITEKIKGNKFWVVCRENLEHRWDNISTTSIETSMEVPQKIKYKATYNPAIPLLNVYSKEIKSICRRNRYLLYSMQSIHNSQNVESV